MNTSIYLQFGNIKGCVSETNHKGWIPLQSCQYSVSRYSNQEDESKSREIGKASVSCLQIFKKMDLSSSQLFLEAHAGLGTDVCKIHFMNGFETFLEYKLINPVVTTYCVNHSEDNHSPREFLTISFTRIETKYTTEENEGVPVLAGYDLTTGKNL